MKPEWSSSDCICLRGLVYMCRMNSVSFSGHRIPFPRSVLPASFCNVNVHFYSGMTGFEVQLQLLVSLWGSVPQSLSASTDLKSTVTALESLRV